VNPTAAPFARELFAQWQRARGDRTEPAARPFSRGWEDLLEDAALVSATDRNDAERDARELETRGWIEIKPVRYKAHLIDRIAIPLAAEPRWREAFGFVPPSDEEARLIREFRWEPPLAFLRELRPNLSFAELRRLNEFLTNSAGAGEVVPIKERSLQIFGDEKRLDALLASSLFGSERLDLERHLRCETVGEPLPWKRGPAGAGRQPVIVIENAATWHSYCRANAEQKQFSAVIYGCGNRFLDGVRYLGDIFAELGGPRPIFYFGDLDPQGLWIPAEASLRAQRLGMPRIRPDLWSYRHLLALGAGCASGLESGDTVRQAALDWLEELGAEAKELFDTKKRIPQEHVGWEVLQDQRGENSSKSDSAL